MPKILFVEYNGNEHLVEADIGATLMQTAVNNAVPGILGDCGGVCACATCHAYIPEDWREIVGAPSDYESQMLEGASHVKDNSRLTCQMNVSAQMDGMRVELPESQ
jgi:ferredoxin, 2Fe-2S